MNPKQCIVVFFRLQSLFETMPRYNCSERCQAPDSFYSGSPYLSFPADSILQLKEDEERMVEWQIWTTNEDEKNNLRFYINDEHIADTSSVNVNGLMFTTTQNNVQFHGKFLKVQAQVKLAQNPDKNEWTIVVKNEKDFGKLLIFFSVRSLRISSVCLSL